KDIIKFLDFKWDDNYNIPTFLNKTIKSQNIIGNIIDKKENLGLMPSLINKLNLKYNLLKSKYFETANISQSNITYIDDTYSTDKIKSEDISVVVQGDVSDKKEVKNNLKKIRKYLPEAEIILSTWEKSNVDKLDYDILVSSRDPGAFDMQPVTWKINNVNRQIISTINGIKKAKRKYVLKLRTDCLIKNSNFLKYFNSKYVNDLKRVKEYSVFKNRILIDSLFTRNSEYDSCTQVGLCFHPSDIWMFGLKEDLEMLFDIPLQDKYIVNINGRDYQYRTPEQYIWTSCLEKNNWNIFMDSCFYNTPYTSEGSLNSIINNFFVLNHNKSGIKFPKKFRKHPKLTFKYVLTTKRYLELYKEYNDSSYKIPKEFKYETLSDIFGVNKYIAELKDLLKPFNFIVKIPMCIIKILLKCITNSYKLIWWLK
ncbi:MAG: WavE lipopolysaccharide synthesis family protein, partial [Candidatus Gastranaerophilales bacterium]|nr:WavE lipopolysaccharide synthesis family protein [Candidatus Gastranaerophilales bacterium]